MRYWHLDTYILDLKHCSNNYMYTYDKKEPLMEFTNLA